MAISSNRLDPEALLSRINRVRRLGDSCASESEPDGEVAKVLETLLKGKIDPQGLMPWSSNYTFLVKLSLKKEAALLGIYKPGEGERPLWDFPDRTLSLREFASYLVSQVLGWPGIPATVLRDGPYGVGTVQLFVEAEYEAHYFNMRDIADFTEDFRQMALFDYIINNADRKGGHCLKGKDGKIWAIDHGLTFHTEPKLRTVIWEFCDEPIPDELLEDLTRLQEALEGSELLSFMCELISTKEIKAFKKRINYLVSTGHFPALSPGRNIPYPPI
jgi:uncharacterized repeat protein (TIGR03843 family)